MAEGLFSADLFRFLADLRKHNDRAWFANNKERYLDSVLEPALEFVRSFGPYLAKISPHFVADDRPSGGSVFRIYRDVRFSKDKSPYKTQVGISFRHRGGKHVHAPGYYLNLEPGSVFAAAGIWHPDRDTLTRIRTAIIDKPQQWKKAAHGPEFRSRYRLSGDALKRAPAGYDPDHPLIDDLKRKDFIAVATLDEEAVTSPGFADELAATLRTSAPFVRFLCEATGVRF
jgi:uncharacterized protein (TIGR02453 family)